MRLLISLHERGERSQLEVTMLFDLLQVISHPPRSYPGVGNDIGRRIGIDKQILEQYHRPIVG